MNLKTKICFYLLLTFSTATFAEVEVWKLSGHFLEFNRDTKTDVLISNSCLIKKCAASNFLTKVSFKNIPLEKFSGGRNPGAVLCHESGIAEVVFLQDLKGNDNSFCLFKDNSLVSSSSIASAARKNDKK